VPGLHDGGEGDVGLRDQLGSDGRAFLGGEVRDKSGRQTAAGGGFGAVGLRFGAILRQVLPAHEAALDGDASVVVERDDRTGDGEGIGWPGFARGLQLIDALVDVGKLVEVTIVAVGKPVVFLGQAAEFGLIGFGQVGVLGMPAKDRAGERSPPALLARASLTESESESLDRSLQRSRLL
jgi:hypothetical protein